MKTLVFDIETMGEAFSEMDDMSRNYFERSAVTDEERKKAEEGLALFPLTGQIVALAMMEADSGKSVIYHQNQGGPSTREQRGAVTVLSGAEEQILTFFWKHVERCDRIVTFNGRCFDGPFIMLRSAIHKIRATRNLVGYRYSCQWHVDLADQMTFYDAWRRRLPLHIWCRAFKIPSPKSEQMNGLLVSRLYREGKFGKIADYCLADVQATRELYRYWDNYLNF